jgi:hypothetical protein
VATCHLELNFFQQPLEYEGSTKVDLTPCLAEINFLRVRGIDVENIQ